MLADSASHEEIAADAVHNCQRSFFEEAPEFFDILAQVLANGDALKDVGPTTAAVPLTAGDSLPTNAADLDKLKQILERYQEQPHLLDPHFERIVTPVAAVLRAQMDLSTSLSPNDALPDGHVVGLYRLLYVLTKVRGYKTVVKFLTHEAADLEPLLAYLQRQDRTRHDEWERRYVLLLWLSLVARIPFDLTRLDSGGTNKADTLTSKLIATAKSFLNATGKEREAAAELLARLLTRRDTVEIHLPPFVEWASTELQTTSSVFLAIGLLFTVATIFKHGQREFLTPVAHLLLPACELVVSGKSRFSSNSLCRKLTIKLAQRIALSFLKPKVAAWRYKRGHRSLVENLAPSAQKVNVDSGRTDGDHGDGHDGEEISPHLETVIDLLLNGLQDKDTIVRWSASKGVGRIAQRLPRDFAQEIIASITELFSDNTFLSGMVVDTTNVSDQTWHGACLALAELARRGLLLPDKLPGVITWIEMALKFDQKRGSFSVGAHVRDAACYVCWSFARAYAPEIMEPFVERLSTSLVVVSIFDREVNVRRAASAAFQENVGRQGIFPHGIDIVTTADYFAVGNRTAAYTEISKEVASFQEYLDAMFEYLRGTSAFHWDMEIRRLTSKALSVLTPFDLKYAVSVALPALLPFVSHEDLHCRHGALISIGEICLAYVNHSHAALSQLPLETLAALPVTLYVESPAFFNSFGSDLFRSGMCRYITCISEIGVPLSDAQRATWLSILDTSLERKEEPVQEEAALAFKAFTKSYPLDADQIRKYLACLHPSSEPFSRRGFNLAVGYIPHTSVGGTPLFDDVIAALCVSATIQEEKTWNDAEARRNAAHALTQQLLAAGELFATNVSEPTFRQAFYTMLNGMRDYSTDARGDVGSWMREACMVSMRLVCQMVLQLDNGVAVKYLQEDLMTNMIARLLQQSVEKIDKVRACAGDVLRWAIAEETKLPHVHGRKELIMALPSTAEINWNNPAEVYGRLMPILHIAQYRMDLLTGILVSVGGITESLVRHSSAAFVDFVGGLPATTDADRMSLLVLVSTINQIFERYTKEERVVIPLLEMLDILFGAGLLQPLAEEKAGSEVLMKTTLLVRREVMKCRDIRKVLAGIKVFCGFAASSDASLRTKSLQYLLSYLVHPFPKIRRYTAEQLYLTLTALPENATMDIDAVEEILTGTNWDEAVAELKATRDQLFPLLRVIPVVAALAASQQESSESVV